MTVSPAGPGQAALVMGQFSAEDFHFIAVTGTATARVLETSSRL